MRVKGFRYAESHEGCVMMTMMATFEPPLSFAWLSWLIHPYDSSFSFVLSSSL